MSYNISINNDGKIVSNGIIIDHNKLLTNNSSELSSRDGISDILDVTGMAYKDTLYLRQEVIDKIDVVLGGDSSIPKTDNPTITISNSVNENSSINGTISSFVENTTYSIISSAGNILYNQGSDQFIFESPDHTSGDVNIYITATMDNHTPSDQVIYTISLVNVLTPEHDQSFVYQESNFSSETNTSTNVTITTGLTATVGTDYPHDILFNDIVQDSGESPFNGIDEMSSSEATINIIDSTNTSTVDKIYVDNSKYNVSIGESFITDNKEFFKVLSVNDNGVDVTNGSIPIKVSCGVNFNAVLFDDGTLRVIGSNNYGQLGIGTTDDSYSWVTSNITDVADVKCGNGNMVVLKVNGEVWVTGDNTNGQLGLGHYDQTNGVWNRLGGGTAKVIAAGDTHIMYVGTDNLLYGVGSNNSGQLGNGSFSGNVNTVTQATIGEVSFVACGKDGTLAVKKSDSIAWGCGYNGYGQLHFSPNNDDQDWSTTGIEVQGSDNLYFISYEYYSSSIYSTDGNYYIAGKNEYGKLSTGDTDDVTTSTAVESGYGSWPIIGRYASIFISVNKYIYTCGHGRQTGIVDSDNLSTSAQSVDVGDDGITDADCGTGSTMYISNGVVYGTGTLFDLGIDETHDTGVSWKNTLSTSDGISYKEEYWVVPDNTLNIAPSSLYGISTYDINGSEVPINDINILNYDTDSDGYTTSLVVNYQDNISFDETTNVNLMVHVNKLNRVDSITGGLTRNM